MNENGNLKKNMFGRFKMHHTKTTGSGPRSGSIKKSFGANSRSLNKRATIKMMNRNTFDFGHVVGLINEKNDSNESIKIPESGMIKNSDMTETPPVDPGSQSYVFSIPQPGNAKPKEVTFNYTKFKQ